MSTRATIAHGPGFHLYHDLADELAEPVVYLRLDGADFEASRDGVTVAVPVAVWEAIRTHAGADFALADLTDGELHDRAARAVAERVAGYDAAVAAGSRNLAFLGWVGWELYGEPTDPPADQTARGVAWLARERDRQRGLRARVAELRGVTAPGGGT